MNKSAIINALSAFIRQRPGLKFCDYGSLSGYRAELRSITKDLKHARDLLAYVACRDSISAESFLYASIGKRLSIAVANDGAVSIDYCEGQYWPTEYRRAVCWLLTSVIRDYWRDECAPSPRPENMGDWLRAKSRKEFGRAVAARFFN